MLLALVYPLASEAQDRYVLNYSIPEGLGFNNPFDVATDSSGNIHVADTDNHRIVKFSKDGKLLTYWGTKGTNNGQFRFPKGIAIDKNVSNKSIFIPHPFLGGV
jgi:DNA-binding beta-propeller fold protein YncE